MRGQCQTDGEIGRNGEVGRRLLLYCEGYLGEVVYRDIQRG